MLSQSLILFSAKIFGYGIRLFLPFFLVRILTKSDIGSYNQFFLMDVLVTTLFQMGVNQSLYYFIPRDRKNSGAYFLNSIMLNVVLYSIAFTAIGIFRVQIADRLGMPILNQFFWYLACYTVLMMLNVAGESFLIARKEIKSAAIYVVVRQVITSIATLLAAYLYRDLEKILLALVFSRIASLLAIMLYIHFKHHGFRSERYFFGIKEQVRYGILLGAAGMIWTLMMRMHEVFVSTFYDIETYAVYSSGCKQIPILLFFSQSITAVALIQFAKLEKEQDWDGIQKLWEKLLGSMYGIGIPITIFLLLVSDPLVRLMYTSDYADAIPIFRLNTLAVMYLVLNPSWILRAMDKNNVTLAVHLSVLAVLPLALYAGMKMFGPVGIIGAHMIMMNGGRLATLAALNRITPVYLPSIASRREVLSFYQSGFKKISQMASRRFNIQGK